jgi:threonine dehydrogenase-like Zn-dependent dehydrogenase
VAVVGGGSIGQCAVFAAKAMGCEVDLYARYDHQFEAAEICGVKEPSGVYDRVVDCVGSADAIQKCIELLKPQGKIIGLAVAWDDIKIPGIPAVNKEASYHTSRCYGLGPDGRDIDIAARMLFDFNELASKIITHRFPIDDAQEAFRTAADRKSGAIKVVLDINI